MLLLLHDLAFKYRMCVKVSTPFQSEFIFPIMTDESNLTPAIELIRFTENMAVKYDDSVTEVAGSQEHGVPRNENVKLLCMQCLLLMRQLFYKENL